MSIKEPTKLLASDMATALAGAFQAAIPKYDVSFTIRHNDHKAVYETAASEIESWGPHNGPRFVSEEEKRKAIETDSIWEACWYPDTPIGSYSIAASTLEALLLALILFGEEN